MTIAIATFEIKLGVKAVYPNSQKDCFPKSDTNGLLYALLGDDFSI